MESSCNECVQQGKIFRKAVFPPSPSPFLCTLAHESLPIGYTIMEEVSNPEKCHGIQPRSAPMIPLGFHKFVVRKLETLLQDCKQMEHKVHNWKPPPGGYTYFYPPAFQLL